MKERIGGRSVNDGGEEAVVEVGEISVRGEIEDERSGSKNQAW